MVQRGILLIDETDELRNACSTFLNGECQPRITSDSTLAITLLKKKEIDVVVVAAPGPVPAVCASLTRLKHRFPSSSLVLTSRNITKASLLTSFRSGIDDVIKSPVDPALLFSSLCRLSLAHSPDEAPNFDIIHLKGCNASAMLVELIEGKPAANTSIIDALRRSRLFAQSLSGAKRVLEKSLQFLHVDGVHSRFSESPLIAERNAWPARGGGVRGTTQGVGDSVSGMDSLADIRVNFFGHFRVAVNNHTIEKWSSHKARLLFAYMLLNRKHLIPRDVLMERFWPNTQGASARDSLNVAIHSIRQTLYGAGAKHNCLLFKEECYYINPEVLLWIDVDEFMRHRQLSHRGEAHINLPLVIHELELARQLYTADFMEEDLYDDWVSMERENLKEMCLDTLDRLSDCYLQSDNAPSAAQLCETILEMDNCREDIHRRLMICYYRMGSRNKAVRQFKKCEEVLKAELKVDPTKQTRQLYEEICNDRLSYSSSNV